MTLAHLWLDGWGVLVWLASAAFWILVIAGIVALIRGHADGGAGASALRLLEERYARGEIPRVEFLERRTVLTGDGPGKGTDTPPLAGAGEDTQPL